MRFLIDAHLPPALARWLSAQGHDAAHVGDLGMQVASDAAIWDYAIMAARNAGPAGRRKLLLIRKHSRLRHAIDFGLAN
jgi:hypothetical protein